MSFSLLQCRRRHQVEPLLLLLRSIPVYLLDLTGLLGSFQELMAQGLVTLRLGENLHHLQVQAIQRIRAPTRSNLKADHPLIQSFSPRTSRHSLGSARYQSLFPLSVP